MGNFFSAKIRVSALFVIVAAFATLSAFAAQVERSPMRISIPNEMVSQRFENFNNIHRGPVQARSKTTGTQVILQDDFESAFPGQWQLFSETMTTWGLSSYRAASGTQSVYCAGGGNAAPSGGPYPNDMNSWMVFGPFSLADATDASLAFSLWMKTEPAADYNTFSDYFFYGVSINGSDFEGFSTAGNTNGWSRIEVDSSEINFLGEDTIWFAFAFFSDGSISDEGVYIDDVIIEASSPDPCTLSCSATAPSAAVVNQSVAFSGQATASNCSQGVSYTWSFGDNTQNSTQQNPNHTYTSAGSFPWQMTARADGQSCSRNGVVLVSQDNVTFDNVWWVPAASHAPGNLGSQWRTDLGILNTGAGSAAVRVDFHTGSGVYSLQRSVAGGAGLVLEDVIDTLDVSDSGPLEVRSDEPIFVTSRTYNQGASGTFGQYLDGEDPVFGLAAGQVASLPQLIENADFRTNLGLLNTSATNLTVRVDLVGSSGSVLKTFNRTIAPGVLKQENRPFLNLAGQSDLERGWARLTVTSGSGLLAYASVVDNRSQDPTTIPVKTSMMLTKAGWIAAAAHNAGNFGSQWRTDLGLLNPGTLTANVIITFRDGISAETLDRQVGPGIQALVEDVVGLMGKTGSGSLEIVSDEPLYITSRTYNQSASGTFGQFLDGFDAGAAIGAGQAIYLPQLTENSRYRTNIGFVNTSSAAATVWVDLYDTGGAIVGQFSQTIEPGEASQKSRPFQLVAGRTDISGGSAKVTLTSGSGVIAYASVIDNATQDPTTIPMKGLAEYSVIRGTVSGLTGGVLSDVTVKTGTSEAVTNGQGDYVINSAPVSDQTRVSFSKAGYISTVKVMRVRRDETNYQDAVLSAVETQDFLQAQTGGTVATADGGSVTIPGGALITPSGSTYTGPASVSLSTFDPSNPDELAVFPGSFEGVNQFGETVGINTYGWADVTITGGSETLDLIPGMAASLELPIPAPLLAEAPQSIPAWWFDPDDQTWHEQGFFVRDGDLYRAQLSHLSVWNCDVASYRCFIVGRVVDSAGDPVKGARVTFRSFRRNGGYVTSGGTSTPEDGTFRVPVDADADIEYWAELQGVESDHLVAHSCSERGGTMQVADINLGPGSGGSDFSYTFNNPHDSSSQTYIARTTNAELFSEGGTGWYWKPEVGGETYETSTPGEVVYHFPFSSNTISAELYVNLPTFNWSYSQGHNKLYASRDGANWVLLLDVPSPAYGAANSGVFNGAVPQSVLGSRDLWLKVELVSFGSSASQGGVWTNTAQHCRYDSNADNTTFTLNVNLQ